MSIDNRATRDLSRLGQLDDDRRCGGLIQNMVSASLHDALDGVALTERNSH
jgi:hypothetical protein